MKKEQRQSTMVRNNLVFKIYEELKKDYGEVFNYISKEYIYEKIHNETGLHPKTIARILNHTYNNSNHSS